MKTLIRWMLIATALVASQALTAQAPAGAPAGATGLCNDGSYWTGSTKSGACRGHKGVKSWYASVSPTPATAPATTPAPAAPSASSAPASSAPAAPAPAMSPAPKGSATTPAPGGGAGQVWLNTATNVYHCEGTRYYGTTKAGAYMTEAAAKAKGARPDHGKPCS
jgi:hypothetical protein